MITEVFRGIIYFVVILLVFVFGFALSLTAFRTNDNDYGHYWMLVWRLSFGDFEDLQEDHQISELIFFLGASFVMPLVMLNLLIAVISEKFDEVLSNNKLADIRERLSLILEVGKFVATRDEIWFSSCIIYEYTTDFLKE